MPPSAQSPLTDTTAAGIRAERTLYRPFGEATKTTYDLATAPESKGYIGERFDADAGLQYLNARYYDPKLGMFLQPDWWEVTKAGVGTNRYSYAGNDPVNGTDASGHATDWAERNREYNRVNGIGQYDPSRSGISTDAWKAYYNNNGGLNGKPPSNPKDASCYQCFDIKSKFPFWISYVDAKTKKPLLNIYAHSKDSLFTAMGRFVGFFNTAVGQARLDVIRQKGRPFEGFEMFPTDSRSASRFTLGMSLAGSFKMYYNLEAPHYLYRGLNGVQDQHFTIGQMVAHETGHGVIGRSGVKEQELSVIKNYESPYLREVGLPQRYELDY